MIAAVVCEIRRRRLLACMVAVADENQTLHAPRIRKDGFLANVSHELRTARGRIELAAMPATNGRIQISVSDTEIGIPSTQHEAISNRSDKCTIEPAGRRVPVPVFSIASRLASLRAWCPARWRTPWRAPPE